MIWLDTETFSEVPIGNGTYAYTSNCEAMIWTSAIDDGPVIGIDLTNDEHPFDIPDLKYALNDPEQLVTAHNSMFDRNVLRYALLMDIAIPRWRDTMVQAFTLSLPGSLDKLCGIFKIGDDLAKIKDGKRLIHLFCKPRGKNVKIRRATRLTHPEEWAAFIEYAIFDTAAMRAVAKKMPTWNYKGDEMDLWHLDQKINDRGFAVDLELAHAALRAVDLEQAFLKAKTFDMTDGEVESTTQRDVLLEHILESYGFALPDLKKDTVERLLDDPDMPDKLKDLLKVRLQVCSTSTSKYKKLIKATTDGKMRGAIQFCGAGRTGRSAGRTFQPQNLPRPNMKNAAIEAGVEALKLNCADLIYSNVMSLTSNAIRGCIVAPPGKKLVVSDLSNIEGRALAYLAGEDWKLQAFRDFDAGIGEDLYKVAYGKAFDVPPAEAVGDKRQIGKVMELMCFGANTQVLTDNGVKSIVAVLDTDKLWDGIEWVKHGGMVARGVKRVVRVRDMWVTPDHLILTKQTWTQAQQLASNEYILHQALETGSENLPSSGTTIPTRRLLKPLAPAAHQRISSTITTFVKELVHGVKRARRSKPGTGEKSTTGMRVSSKIKNTVHVFLEEFPRASTVAIIPTTAGMLTTVRGVSGYTKYGSKTVKNSLDTLSRSLVGMIRVLSWIEQTLIKATNPVTYASLLIKKINKIKERYKASKSASVNWKSKSETWRPVYDLLLAGPRSRFTVITEAGPLIVHNCGYEGGVGAYLTGAATYRIDLDHMAAMCRPSIPEDIWNEAIKFWHWCHKTKRTTYGLSKDVFCACDSLKRMWRLQHPNIVAFWGEVQEAVILAIREPGITFLCRKVKVRRTGEWLRIALPSGRALCYPSPRIDDKGKISYEGVNQFSRKWCRMDTYSGKLVENITQAFARDVFKSSFIPVENAGYEIVLEVHDELITEVPDTEDFNVGRLSELLATNPPWAQGMPLAAAGFETYRYRKG